MAVLRALRCPLAIACALAAPAAAQSSSGWVSWGAHVCNPHWNEEPFVRLVAGANSTAAFRANGTFVAWGESHEGQCRPPALPAGVVYVDLGFGGGNPSSTIDQGFAFGLGSDGVLRAWGENQWGQCNVPGLPLGTTYTAASAGWNFGVAIRSDGLLAAWGLNDQNQCAVPPPPAGQSFVQVAAGWAHGLGLLSNGNVVGWGSNASGCSVAPALPPGTTYVGLAAGLSFSLALRSDGTLIAWGSNVVGQCNVPTLPAGTTYTGACAGKFHSLAVRSDGTVLAWGSNAEHACDVPVPPIGVSYLRAQAGVHHSAALRSDGLVVCWGANGKLQCNRFAPSSGGEYVKLSCSSYYGSFYGYPANESPVLALRNDGNLDIWGAFPAAPALPPAVTYTDVAAGSIHALGLRSDGTVVAWGNCGYGACSIPALPPGMRYVGIAASGGYHYDSCGFGYEWTYARSFLLRSDGAHFAIGDSSLGQIWLPTPPAGIPYVEIAAASCATVARRSDGTAAECGSIPSMPAPPPGTSWVAFAATGGDYWETGCLPPSYLGQRHALGLRSDGGISAWGDNVAGETNVPALPPGLVYVQVANTSALSLARRSDGSVVAWGNNYNGECEVPVLPAGEVYRDIACGPFGCFARYGPAPACGSIAHTCVAAANSISSSGARLEASGCAGISANSLVLDVHGLPASTMGMFLYASGQVQLPFGNGWGCLAGGIQRVLPPLQGSAGGAVSFAVDLTQYPFTGSAHSILPGSSWYFQYWYRDPLATPATFNTSDALQSFFAP